MDNKKQSDFKPIVRIKSIGNIAQNILNTPLNKICVNPFINKPKFSSFDYLKIYGFGSILFLVRIIPMLLCIAIAGLLASIFSNSINLLNLIGIPNISMKKVAKYIVFGFLRCALFFSGFYWVRVTEKSTKKGIKPTIIPIAPHSTFWDTIAMLKLGVPAIVSRIENSKVPFIGSIINLCDPVYVNREDKDSRLKATNDIKMRASVGNIMLFPEGTCTNRKALIQFKMGAFLPSLPVQPVVIKWGVGNHDMTSWVEEGPGAIKILFYSLTELWTSCEIIKLEPYLPNEEEKRNPRLYADNVQKVMCEELGVLQSFYAFDDVMFMGFANEIRIFRSPVCIKLLKVCYRMARENSSESMSGSSLSKRIKAPKLAPIFNANYFGIGEDFDHTTNVPDFYIPKVLPKMTKTPKEIIKKTTNDENSNVKRLPLSGVIRNPFEATKTTPQIALTSDVAQQKRYVYETFCGFVEKCINNIEEKGQIRPIESTKHLAELLGFDSSSKTLKSSVFVDLLKAIEFTAPEGPTTLHLLIVLHLCDCREPDLWERIRAAVNLLSLHMKTSSKTDDNSKPDSESEPPLNLLHFKTLLWYSLGIQQFNDSFFIGKDFDFNYIKNNMKTQFKRAVSENAESLL